MHKTNLYRATLKTTSCFHKFTMENIPFGWVKSHLKLEIRSPIQSQILVTYERFLNIAHLTHAIHDFSWFLWFKNGQLADIVCKVTDQTKFDSLINASTIKLFCSCLIHVMNHQEDDWSVMVSSQMCMPGWLDRRWIKLPIDSLTLIAYTGFAGIFLLSHTIE